MKRLTLALVVVLGATAHGQEPRLHLPPLDRVLPPRAEAIYQALAPRIDTSAAVETVRFMAPLWRLAGNPAFDRSIDFIAERLARGGFPLRGAADGRRVASHWVESYENTGQGWEQRVGTLALEPPKTPTSPDASSGAHREVVLSRDQDRIALCINSFSTPPGGARFRLVDVGAGRPEDFQGQNLRGAVVLGDAPVGALWTRAVRDGGAAGVVSTDLARYTQPESTPEVLQWGSVPYDETRRAFGFKATPRATRRLRGALAAAPTEVHVEIDTRFHRGKSRTLVAEIPGQGAADERVVLVAHVQEPGANDNASGSATLLSVALAIRRALAAGQIPPPKRTLTFLWLDEIRGSERWIADDPARAGKVAAMMSLDMTGEDTAKTGGTFLIEKSPDPSAIWPRPSDPHSEWGTGQVDRARLHGHLLNDLHLAVALRRARDTGWIVRTNPYEGGSDHTVFTRAGVPALLNWHFTDRYYHTNLDTVDKTSGTTMQHVATVVSTTAVFLAAADATDADALRQLVDDAERARAETEQLNGASDEILAAWRKWYAEARGSVALVAR
jgi:aminopeptidase YwaD